MDIQIELHDSSFEPLEALREWQGALALDAGGPPAAEAWFIGRVRGHSREGAALTSLELEHYPGMTERTLARQADGLGRAHGVRAIVVRHRVGRVQPGEAIVLVGVAADRRGQAQRCCQELLEALKHDAPFWKREHLSSGEAHWLQGNTAF
jgi:molybdopterin synthase catalytic subunit